MSRDVHVWKALKAGCFLLFITTSLYGQDAFEKGKLGWIKVDTDLDSAYVVIDDRFYEPHLITNGGVSDSIETRIGPRKVTVVWRTIDDIERRTYVYKDTTRQLNIEIESTGLNPKTSFYTIQRQYNLEISGAENTDIYLNRKFIGQEKVRVLNIHDIASIEMYHPEKGYLEYETEVSTQNVTTVNRYFDEQVDRSWIYYSVPLLKQSVEREWGKVITQSLSYLTFGTLVYYYGQEIPSARTEFKYYKQAYTSARTSWEIADYRPKMLNKHNKLDYLLTVQDVMIGGLVATYLAGVVDALFIQPRKGYKGASKFNGSKETVTHRLIPDVSMLSLSHNQGDGLTITLSWGL